MSKFDVRLAALHATHQKLLVRKNVVSVRGQDLINREITRITAEIDRVTRNKAATRPPPRRSTPTPPPASRLPRSSRPPRQLPPRLPVICTCSYCDVIVEAATDNVKLTRQCFDNKPNPQLSILINTLTSRAESCHELVTCIAEQATGGVEVLTAEDDGTTPSGAKRQLLLTEARGDYVAYVDDDDEISDEYIQAILAGCASGADVVTFDLLYEAPSKDSRVWSLRLGASDPVRGNDHLKDVSKSANHLCTWKRSMARQIPFSPIWYMDDVFWYKPLLLSGLAAVEHHIDAVLYRYRYQPDKTQNQNKLRVRHTLNWAAGGVGVYRHKHTGQTGVGVYDVAYSEKRADVLLRFSDGLRHAAWGDLELLGIIKAE